MNPVYPCRFLLFLLLLLPLTLPAQPPTDWAPFPPETRRDYEWGTDTLITMRSGMWDYYPFPSGPADFYGLSRIAIPPDSSVLAQCPSLRYQMKNGYWGDTVRLWSPGEWHISMGDGSEVIVKPQQALGQSWSYDAQTGVSAQVVARTYIPVLGQMDSVAVILLSTGDTIRTGKHSGWISGKPPREMHELGTQSRTAYLKSIHETMQGYRNADFYDVFDFDPGDVFEYRYSASGYPDLFYKHVILSQTYAGASGFSYDVYRERCLSTGIVYPPDTITISYDTADYPELMFSNLFFQTDFENMNGWIEEIQFRDSTHFGRETIRLDNQWYGCMAGLGDYLGFEDPVCLVWNRQFREGTGLIRELYINFVTQLTEMTFYRTFMSRDSMGTPYPFPTYVVGVNAPKIVPARLYPNPAKDAVQLDFGLEQAVPEWIRISDAQGRVLRTIRMEPRVVRQSITLQDLPAGMLLLEYEGPAGRQVLRCIHMP